MEFKDRLKELRLRHKLSQAQLAESIFVSRSAIAKWENGLGYPNEDSLQALIDFFCVPQDHFSTQEPEAVIVEKNRRINRLSACLIAIGCTGGQHRSVYSAEHLAAHLRDKYGVKVVLEHREQNKLKIES